MADQQEGQEPTPNEPQGQGNEPAPDYKALYEKALAESRKWESRAKSNKAASERLEKLGSEGKTPEERIEELTRRLDEKEKAETRARTALQVSEAKGVPADLIVGETQEEMEAWADRLAAYAKPPAAPKVPKAGKFSRGPGGDAKADFGAFMNETFN